EVRLASERQERAEKLAAAERDRQDAERKRAHEAVVIAARQLARRGDWANALPEFDVAVRDGEADARRLRVERLVGYFALNQIADLTQELDALEREELDDLAAQVKLVRGAWLLCDFDRQGEGRAIIREALNERHPLFSPADVAFAEA